MEPDAERGRRAVLRRLSLGRCKGGKLPCLTGADLGCWESRAVLLHGGRRALRAPLLSLAGL